MSATLLENNSSDPLVGSIVSLKVLSAAGVSNMNDAAAAGVFDVLITAVSSAAGELQVLLPCGVPTTSHRDLISATTIDRFIQQKNNDDKKMTLFDDATLSRVPQSLRDITPKFLRAVLQRPGTERVNKLHVVLEQDQQRRSSAHFMTSCYSVKTAAELGKPLFVLFGKFLAHSSSSSSSARVSDQFRRFARESCVYQILNQLPVVVAPVCHYSFMAPAMNEKALFGAAANPFFLFRQGKPAFSSMLLLEELPLSYAPFAPRFTIRTRDASSGGLTDCLPDVSAILPRIANTLAALHAPFHFFCSASSDESVQRSSAFAKFATSVFCHPDLFRDALKKRLLVRHSPSSSTSSCTKNQEEHQHEQAEQLLTRMLCEDRLVLVHGGLNNGGHILLDRTHARSNAILVDWKRAGFGPAELDLLFAFGLLPPNIRVVANSLDILLESYIAAMTDFGGSASATTMKTKTMHSVLDYQRRMMCLARALLLASATRKRADDDDDDDCWSCCDDWLLPRQQSEADDDDDRAEMELVVADLDHIISKKELKQKEEQAAAMAAVEMERARSKEEARKQQKGDDNE